MTYIRDEDIAAPQLRSIRPVGAEAESLFKQLVRQLEIMLISNVIHADLSPYNVLVWEDKATLIDLPQAVDPRKNRHAHDLLERDVRRICEHFDKLGVRSSPDQISGDLWTSWTFADLIPGDLLGR